MATVVPFASCYGGAQPLQVFGRGPRGANYLSLFGHRGPCFAPRPRLVCHNPKMTLRQILRMLKMMKRVRKREAAAAAAAASSRKQGSPPPDAPPPDVVSDGRCVPSGRRRVDLQAPKFKNSPTPVRAFNERQWRAKRRESPTRPGCTACSPAIHRG